MSFWSQQLSSLTFWPPKGGEEANFPPFILLGGCFSAAGWAGRAFSRWKPLDPCRENSSHSKGVTLLEVLLTLAVLVLMAGIAWPVLSRAFENQRLKKSADIIRAHWTQARVQAMSTGYVYIFQFMPGQERFSIYRRVASEVEVSPDGQFQAAQPDSVRPFGKEETLPEGIRFAGGEVLWDTRAEMYSTDPTAFLSPDQGWSSPVFFYPDGTTSTARLVLENERGRRVDISLRGLTGMVSISDIYTAEEAQP